MRLQRHWGLILTALAIIAALLWAFLPQPVPVDVAAVARAPLRVTVDEEGRTRVIDRYVVSAPVTGYARRIELRVGDTVRQGQTLVELEPLRSEVLDPRSRAAAEAAVAAAEAGLHMAEQNARAAASDADIAEQEYVRRKALSAKGSIAGEERDRAAAVRRRAEAALRSAAFAVDVARHELAAARTALEHSAARAAGEMPERVAVRAPIDGRILAIARESEGVVASGQALLEIGDPSALEIEVEVLSADAVRIQPGMAVEFTRWGGSGVLRGAVRTVQPTGFTKISALGVEEQRVVVIADLVSPPQLWTRLGDGYRVEASFVLWDSDAVLQLPASALFRQGDAWAAFVVDAGRARLREVQIGHNNGFAAQVVDGLQDGMVVIAHPSDAVHDGVRIAPRGE